jgi:thiol-disulfide isomerase/thioredoxin
MNKNLLIIIILAFFTACNIEEEGISDEQIIIVSSEYGSQVITGYDIPFTAKDGQGNDITQNVLFTVNGTQQNSNIIRFDQAGSYQVVASINLDGQQIVSTPFTVNVSTPSYTTKILVEDYTGTWCTNCPRVAYHLEQAVNQNPNIIPVAIHYSRWAGDDPFGFDDVTILAADFGIQALPSPVVNRTPGFIWDDSQFNVLQAELDKPQALGLAINSNVSGNTLDINVRVGFDMDMTSRKLSLVIYITESNLFADQANSTGYYGGQDPIPDFEQKHTLRTAINGVYGMHIPESETAANHIYTYNYSGNIPVEVSDINHCDIVAFVIDEDNQKILLNIQQAAIGTNQDFD